MKARLTSLLAVAALAASFQASATVLTLNFTATEENGTDFSQTIGDTRYDQWFVTLDKFLPFAVSQGDEIDATVTFKNGAAHTIPAATQMMSFLLVLRSTDPGHPFPGGTVAVDGGTATFYLGGEQGAQVDFNDSTITQISAGGTYPGGVSQTFDTVNFHFTVSTLSATATINSGSLISTGFNPVAVPEPATNAMLLAGLAVVGGLTARARRRAGRC